MFFKKVFCGWPCWPGVLVLFETFCVKPGNCPSLRTSLKRGPLYLLIILNMLIFNQDFIQITIFLFQTVTFSSLNSQSPNSTYFSFIKRKFLSFLKIFQSFQIEKKFLFKTKITKNITNFSSLQQKNFLHCKKRIKSKVCYFAQIKTQIFNFESQLKVFLKNLQFFHIKFSLFLVPKQQIMGYIIGQQTLANPLHERFQLPLPFYVVVLHLNRLNGAVKFFLQHQQIVVIKEGFYNQQFRRQKVGHYCVYEKRLEYLRAL
eukprot:TRINITY_DN10452_c0_g3_i1.p2 TRINITY_DN10452_c0_g3~~TRINITY_DN10452_c0_g3_i1.p2  ORF type:complete len:260 (-),score=-2.99 TRINITY_DN10452_c0_g3_i1:606-1385(-)